MNDFLLTVLAVFTAHIFHGVFFSIFRANQYEDVLAKKIAIAVSKEIKSQTEELQSERQAEEE